MASIKRLEGKDGASYKITVSLGRDARGKQIRRYMTWKPEPGLTARQIEKRVKQVAVDFEKQLDYGFQADNRQTFDEYAKYVISIKAESGTAQSSLDTFERWRNLISPFIGNKKVKDIRPQHIREIYTELRKPGSKSTSGKAFPKINFKEFVKQYGSQHKFAEMAGVSNSTMLSVYQGKRIGYASAKKIADAVDKPIENLFDVDMQDKEILKGNTLRGLHSFLGVVFKQAEMDMLIEINPVKRVPIPQKEDVSRNFFQPEQIAEILKAAENEPIMWRTMLNLFVVSGARRGELLGLKWDKVDFKRNQITIDRSLIYTSKDGLVDAPTKTRNIRWVPLPAETMKMLNKYRVWQLEKRLMWGDQWHDLGYVFTSEHGKPLYTTSINTYFNKFSEKYNLPHINPHAFRHTAASIMISQGVDVVSVSQMLGHSTTTTTLEVYAHAIEETKRTAAACIADTILRRQA